MQYLHKVVLRYIKCAITNMVKHTNWWNNVFVYTHQFISNSGYRTNMQRNYEIVNVGSNPARFAFFYEDILGENWSTGTQSLDRDLDILKYYHSYLKDGATVLLPIVPFSSVTGYLHIHNWDSLPYKSKFLKILDNLQTQDKYYYQAKDYIQHPLHYNRNAWKYIFHDVERDKRLDIVENPMQLCEMEHDAANWMKCWKDEFSIKSFRDQLTDDLQKGRELSLEMMGELIEFLQERGYRTVIISPPISKSLNRFFTPEIKEIYIDSFVRDIQKKYKVEYMDYLENKEFQNHKYYFNALFMNLQGRKLFTKRVLTDLKLMEKHQ